MIERRALDRAGNRHRAELDPEILERLAGTVAPVARPALQHDRGIDRAGAGAAHRLELDATVLDQRVEHAPGEGSMRAAALQCEIDAPDLVHPSILRALAALRCGYNGTRRGQLQDRGRAHGNAVAQAAVDHSLGSLARPAHHLGPGLLHLPAVRRADGEGARLVARPAIWRPVGGPPAGRPV